MESSNDEDEMIERLRAARRAEGDPRWQALTLGALSAEESEALRREAPEQFEVHRPFDDAEQARLFDGLQQRLGEKSRVIPLASWRRRLLRVAAPLAAAAAVALVFASTRPGPVEVAWSEPRGDAAVVHLSSAPGARLTELIIPRSPLKGPIAVRGSLLARPRGAGPGRVHAWSLTGTSTADGEIVISGTREGLFPGVESGDWDMIVIVGLPGAPLSDDEVRRLADGGASRELRVLRKRVVLDGPCVGTPCGEGSP
jgi:hypothetical protein